MSVLVFQSAPAASAKEYTSRLLRSIFWICARQALANLRIITACDADCMHLGFMVYMVYQQDTVIPRDLGHVLGVMLVYMHAAGQTCGHACGDTAA